jgi:integration host factor subunit alpha
LTQLCGCARIEFKRAGGSIQVKGETLTRADLTEAVHEEVGLTRQDCSLMVERTLDLIAQALQDGEIVKLSGFGVFQVREKRARMGRNPKTGEPAAIDPRRVISFRASQVMKAKVEHAFASGGPDSGEPRGVGAMAGEAIG